MRNRGGNQKPGLHSPCAAKKKKNVARLGAAEVPADRETSVVSLSCFLFRASERSCSLVVSFIATTCSNMFYFLKEIYIYEFFCLFSSFPGSVNRVCAALSSDCFSDKVAKNPAKWKQAAAKCDASALKKC